MMTVALVGVVLALTAVIVYITRKWGGLNAEKAALENSKTAHDAKLELLESTALKNEAELREREKNDAEAFDDDMERSTTRFYPKLREDKDRLN